MNLSWAFVLIPTSSLRASFTRGRVGTNMRTPPIGEKVPLQAPSRCCAARHSALLLLFVVRKRPGAYDFSALSRSVYGTFAPVAPGLLLPISLHTAYSRTGETTFPSSVTSFLRLPAMYQISAPLFRECILVCGF